jgi:hypothetical protein
MSPQSLRVGALLILTAGFLASFAGGATADTPSCKAGKEHARVSLVFGPSEAQIPITVVLALAYDPSLTTVPESGSAPAVRKRVHTRQDGAMTTPNRADPALLRVVVTKPAGLKAGPLVDVDFDRCAGARAPTVGDFRCTLEACAGDGGGVDCTCTVTVQ